MEEVEVKEIKDVRIKEKVRVRVRDSPSRNSGVPAPTRTRQSPAVTAITGMATRLGSAWRP